MPRPVRPPSAELCRPAPVQVGIYFPLYDALAADLAKGPAGAQAPLVAGAVARTAAVLCTSPLELVRTRMQVIKPTAEMHDWNTKRKAAIVHTQ